MAAGYPKAFRGPHKTVRFVGLRKKNGQKRMFLILEKRSDTPVFLTNAEWLGLEVAKGI